LKRLEELKEEVRRGRENIENIKKRDVEWEKRWKELEERDRRIEDELVEKVMERWEERRREAEGCPSEESMDKRSRSERESGTYRKGSRTGSMGTIWSEDRLSNKEVEKVRKWVKEKEREERKGNIILREVTMPVEIEGERKKRQEWVKELIKNKVGVECDVGEVRKSGPVIVAKIINEEGKKDIMKKKYKLKREKLFIENDLSYEERKVQEKMNRWAKGKMSIGIEVKLGRGRVKIRDRWIAWEDIEREEREKEEMRREERERSQREESLSGEIGRMRQDFG